MSYTPTPITHLGKITFGEMLAVKTENFFDNNGCENVLMVKPGCPEGATIILPHGTQLKYMEIVACSTAHGKVPMKGQKCERVPYPVQTSERGYKSNRRRGITHKPLGTLDDDDDDLIDPSRPGSKFINICDEEPPKWDEKSFAEFSERCIVELNLSEQSADTLTTGPQDSKLKARSPIDAKGETTSAGFLAGNAVTLPVNIPVNACSLALLDETGSIDPELAKECQNQTIDPRKRSAKTTTVLPRDTQIKERSSITFAGVSNSPGALSGNIVQVPVHVPVNACGNSISVIGALNTTFGNVCVNASAVLRRRSAKGMPKAEAGDMGYVVFIRGMELEKVGQY
ncbi:hypothetical protein TWF694_010487 [Orbilia ellipsospora]|uniref:Chaplin domain-containing protein n=1 Tax=Orbilia ellipsospora TaxID=2528407 RepID=A0AAV9XAD8_9PEZI